MPGDLISKESNVATIIQCGGLWFSNGKFGVTWRLQQAVVKPRESLMGKCHIELSNEEKRVLEKQVEVDSEVETVTKQVDTTQVEDSEEEEEEEEKHVVETVSKEVAQAVAEQVPEKKKPVVRRKKAEPNH